jgi:hypothetical protein
VCVCVCYMSGPNQEKCGCSQPSGKSVLKFDPTFQPYKVSQSEPSHTFAQVTPDPKTMSFNAVFSFASGNPLPVVAHQGPRKSHPVNVPVKTHPAGPRKSHPVNVPVKTHPAMHKRHAVDAPVKTHPAMLKRHAVQAPARP